MAEKTSSVKDAIREWEQTTGGKAIDARELDLQFFFPPISVMDSSLLSLEKCEKLFLSTNVIAKIQNLQGMKNLTVLSLARNSITSIAGIEPVAGTLEALYLSYNHINALKGITVMTKLKTLYLNNNSVRDINEVLRINDLPLIEDVSFIGTTIKDALKMWEKQLAPPGEESSKEVAASDGEGGGGGGAGGRSAIEAREIDLQFCWPPIEQMDKTLGTLVKCKKLFLSTNVIEKIQGLQGMNNLRVLSLSRNSIKMLQGIEAVAETLEELWLSFNHLVSIKGIQVMGKLRVLYLNHNYIRDWAEIARLAEMPKIADVAFLGNPVQEHCATEEEWRNGVFKRVPQLRRLDGAFRTYG